MAVVGHREAVIGRDCPLAAFDGLIDELDHPAGFIQRNPVGSVETRLDPRWYRTNDNSSICFRRNRSAPGIEWLGPAKAESTARPNTDGAAGGTAAAGSVDWSEAHVHARVDGLVVLALRLCPGNAQGQFFLAGS